MIASCYSMDIYCDCRRCKDRPWMKIMHTFTGESWASCAKQARDFGWRIGKDKQRAFAKGHKICRIDTPNQSNTMAKQEAG